jgi:prepilin-type processing-associated H-X9-DG protein
MPAYTPGPDPNKYWFVIEDQRVNRDDGHDGAAGDTDFNDFDLRVIEQGIDVTVTGYHRSAGFTFGLVDMEGKLTYEEGGVIGPLELQGVRRLSYGMNTQVHQIAEREPNGGTIILVDYKDDEVITSGVAMSLGEWDLNRAPRHMGKMKALYADGHVQGHEPDEIDPAMSYGEGFWSPFVPVE